MRKREERPISKHTLNLFAGDYEKLQRYYGPRIGAAKIVRDIIHAHVRRVEAAAAQKVPMVDHLDVEFET